MTNKEKAELYDLATRCNTCMARNGDIEYRCNELNCSKEYKKNLDWLMEDYKQGQEDKPPVDWSKVPVDTLVRVSDDGLVFRNAHFAKYDGTVATWVNGMTSKTVSDENEILHWDYYVLAEE